MMLREVILKYPSGLGCLMIVWRSDTFILRKHWSQYARRTQVLQDMLQLLKESAASRHAERLEQIVIALIAVEIGMSTLAQLDVQVNISDISHWNYHHTRGSPCCLNRSLPSIS
jgi:hypothetical protein